MKSVLSFGPNYSPRAYNGTLPGAPIQFAAHEFLATADGQLQHMIDGKLCATVPPEGLTDYRDCWPAAAPVIDTLLGAERSAAATIDAPANLEEPDNLSGQDAPGA